MALYITSDLKKIHNEVLHRAVSRYHPKVQDIPRIFILDTSRGLNALKNGQVTRSLKLESKLRNGSWQYLEPSGASSDSGRLMNMLHRDLPPIVSPSTPMNVGGTHLTVADIPNQWSYSSRNTEDNLAVMCSSDARSEMGSYFMNHWSASIKENIEGKLEKRLSDICDEIEEKMRLRGRLTPDFELGGETRNIMMRINDHTDISTISSEMVRTGYDKEDTFEVYQ